MKISTDRKEDFKPITLSITMENMDELCTIYSVFNFIPITGFIGKHCGTDIPRNIRGLLRINGDDPLYKELHGELYNIWREDV